MNKPYIICHMITSIDGKITGDFLGDEKFSSHVEEYYRLNREFKADAFLCGRKTMEESFPQETPENVKVLKPIEKVDFVATKSDYYAVCIDSKGKQWWNNSVIIDEDEGYNNAHIISVVSENVSNEFLQHLQNNHVSYIFCGKEDIDLTLLCHKLKMIFGINKLLVEGGGVTNSLFQSENLIDELSIVVTPTIELGVESKLNFSSMDSNKYIQKVYELKQAKVLDNNGLWLNYVINNVEMD